MNPTVLTPSLLPRLLHRARSARGIASFLPRLRGIASLLPRLRGIASLLPRLRGRVGWGWPMIPSLLALLSCGPPPQAGVTPLPLGQAVALALGRQRLLLPVDPTGHYHVHLAAMPGDSALLVASVCTLDPHRRVDEGDSHCLDQEVVTGPDGSSDAEIAPPERRFNALVMRIYSEGPSAGPVTLRVDRSEPP
jgi:hypothetical protein